MGGALTNGLLLEASKNIVGYGLISADLVTQGDIHGLLLAQSIIEAVRESHPEFVMSVTAGTRRYRRLRRMLWGRRSPHKEKAAKW
jgi:hypothetical protein